MPPLTRVDVQIGSLVLDYPLKWIDKGQPNVVGSDVQCRTGHIVMIRGTASQEYIPAKLMVDWASWSDIETLRTMWLSGNEYTMNPEGVSGETYTIRFAAENGVEQPTHPAYGDDAIKADVEEADLINYWNAVINVIIIDTA